MEPHIVLRLGAVGLLGLTVFGAAFALNGSKVPKPVRTYPAIVPADPLAAELTRCRNLGLEAASEPTCKEVWVQNRARFFSPRKASTER